MESSAGHFIHVHVYLSSHRVRVYSPLYEKVLYECHNLTMTYSDRFNIKTVQHPVHYYKYHKLTATFSTDSLIRKEKRDG